MFEAFDNELLNILQWIYFINDYLHYYAWENLFCKNPLAVHWNGELDGTFIWTAAITACSVNGCVFWQIVCLLGLFKTARWPLVYNMDTQFAEAFVSLCPCLSVLVLCQDDLLVKLKPGASRGDGAVNQAHAGVMELWTRRMQGWWSCEPGACRGDGAVNQAHAGVMELWIRRMQGWCSCEPGACRGDGAV